MLRYLLTERALFKKKIAKKKISKREQEGINLFVKCQTYNKYSFQDLANFIAASFLLFTSVHPCSSVPLTNGS